MILSIRAWVFIFVFSWTEGNVSTLQNAKPESPVSGPLMAIDPPRLLGSTSKGICLRLSIHVKENLGHLCMFGSPR